MFIEVVYLAFYGYYFYIDFDKHHKFNCLSYILKVTLIFQKIKSNYLLVFNVKIRYWPSYDLLHPSWPLFVN